MHLFENCHMADDLAFGLGFCGVAAIFGPEWIETNKIFFSLLIDFICILHHSDH